MELDNEDVRKPEGVLFPSESTQKRLEALWIELRHYIKKIKNSPEEDVVRKESLTKYRELLIKRE